MTSLQPGTNAADDFDFIRNRIAELKKEKAEAEKLQGEVADTGTANQTETGEWIYGKDAFKMEHLGYECPACNTTLTENAFDYALYCNVCNMYVYNPKGKG